MELVLFDLDNTLITGDSDFEWAQFLITKGVLDKKTHEIRNQEFYDHYKAGTLDIDEFLDFQLTPLAKQTRAELDAWHPEFMRDHILPIMGAPAKQLVQQCLEAGHLCAMVTATNSFVTSPIARAFGISHLIATIPACDQGRFTGQVRGVPSFREGKITRVEAWLESQGLWWTSFSKTRFYSDSLNDLPLLECVSHPVAVDPDDTLRQVAQSKGWEIISLRPNAV